MALSMFLLPSRTGMDRRLTREILQADRSQHGLGVDTGHLSGRGVCNHHLLYGGEDDAQRMEQASSHE
jgi:hypothetical protein